jgi:hypothetical protein
MRHNVDNLQPESPRLYHARLAWRCAPVLHRQRSPYSYRLQSMGPRTWFAAISWDVCPWFFYRLRVTSPKWCASWQWRCGPRYDAIGKRHNFATSLFGVLSGAGQDELTDSDSAHRVNDSDVPHTVRFQFAGVAILCQTSTPVPYGIPSSLTAKGETRGRHVAPSCSREKRRELYSRPRFTPSGGRSCAG